MHKFTFLEHTADTRLQLEAETFPELFQAGIEGLSQLIYPLKDGELSHTEKLSIHSIDRTSLLVDFLSEVLLLSHLKKVVFQKVEFIKLTDNELECKIYGIPTDGFMKDVKAVTYHGAEVKESDKFETVIIFDI